MIRTLRGRLREGLRAASRFIEIPFDSGTIISLIGVRRSGKTHLLYSIIDL
ncbi:MAG: hypothetical protein ACYC6Q_00985 [Syntrophales bacterium]